MRGPPAAPPDLVLVPPEHDETRTTRQRFERHSESPTCATCHAQIDPLGFAFEHYDGVGVYRSTDAGQPVDASGVLTTQSQDADGPFADAPTFLARLASSQQAQECLRREFFRFMSMQSGEETEAAFLTEVTVDDLEEALIRFVASDLFTVRRVP